VNVHMVVMYVVYIVQVCDEEEGSNRTCVVMESKA